MLSRDERAERPTAEYPYRYETHLHTAEVSACGKAPARDCARRYHALGYTGIFVTDHFYRGNCGIDPTLDWPTWVARFCSGFEAAKAEGDRLGLDVFFGWEERFDDDEYLIYGLDKQWLLANPQVRGWTRREQYEQVHRHGGCVIQAHPFRQRDYFSAVHLAMGCVHGVEAYNSASTAGDNALSAAYARRLALPMLAGSDTHALGSGAESRLASILLPSRVTSAQSFAEHIRSRRPVIMSTPDSSPPCPLDAAAITLPVYLHTAQDRAELLSPQAVRRLLSGH